MRRSSNPIKEVKATSGKLLSLLTAKIQRHRRRTEAKDLKEGKVECKKKIRNSKRLDVALVYTYKTRENIPLELELEIRKNVAVLMSVRLLTLRPHEVQSVSTIFPYGAYYTEIASGLTTTCLRIM